jgi:cytochrome c oxidase assembly protein subunit 15
MVEWKPLYGVLPPLTDTQWNDVFRKYQSSPEFQEVNSWMEVSDFKEIFFWEYLHRIWGRLIGLFYALGMLYFFIRKKVPSDYKLKIIIGFLLGGLQGLMGWYMVRSGLVDNPHVSHYRLALHLGLAFFIIAYLQNIVCQLKAIENNSNLSRFSSKTKSLFHILVSIFVIQFIFGAFVAGLKAGLIFNSFPLMNGTLWPFEVGSVNVISNWINDPTHVQWMHRFWGSILLVGFLIYSVKIYQSGLKHYGYHLPTLLISYQYILGILTLIYHVPIELGVAHQVWASLIVITLVRHHHKIFK